MTKFEETLTTVLVKEKKRTRLKEKSLVAERYASVIEEYLCDVYSYKKKVFQIFSYVISVFLLGLLLNSLGYFTFGSLIILMLAMFIFYVSLPPTLLFLYERKAKKLRSRLYSFSYNKGENNLLSLYRLSTDDKVEYLRPEIVNILPRAARIVEAYQIVEDNSSVENNIEMEQTVMALDDSVTKFLVFVQQEKKLEEFRIEGMVSASKDRKIQAELETKIFPDDIDEVNDALISAKMFKQHREKFL